MSVVNHTLDTGQCRIVASEYPSSFRYNRSLPAINPALIQFRGSAHVDAPCNARDPFARCAAVTLNVESKFVGMKFFPSLRPFLLLLLSSSQT